MSALADMQGEVQPLDVVAFLWFAAQNAMKGPEADERLFRRDSIEFAATEVPEFKLKVLNREYPRLRGVVERLMEGHEGRSQSEAVAALGPEHRRLLQVLHFVKEIDGTYYVTPALSTILGLDMSDGEYHGRAVRLVIDAVIED